MLRKLFWRELNLVHEGQATKQWKSLEAPIDLPHQPGAEQSSAEPAAMKNPMAAQA